MTQTGLALPLAMGGGSGATTTKAGLGADVHVYEHNTGADFVKF